MTLSREGKAFAPSNIALIKYWGKRDRALNLPITSSLSVTLGQLGTCTTLRERPLEFKGLCQYEGDHLYLGDTCVDPQTEFHRKATRFLSLSRPTPETRYELRTASNIPIAAGLASSASGFAALTLALNDLYQWNLSIPDLSRLARQGSGSACRSLEQGFVEWHAGSRADGMDSYGTRLEVTWPEFSIGIIVLSDQPKPISSRLAMERTRETSTLYQAWPTQVANDLARIRPALLAKDIETVGQVAEHNALSMHATLLSADPAILYSTPKTVEIYHTLWAFRQETGIPVYLTQDAGPNVKLITLAAYEARIESIFPTVHWVHPFEACSATNQQILTPILNKCP
jgi:diphosphomevalonate decarboxylase